MGENAMPRQPNPGSTYQRASDGKWVTALSLGGGKRVVRYAPTSRADRVHGAATMPPHPNHLPRGCDRSRAWSARQAARATRQPGAVWAVDPRLLRELSGGHG